MSLVLVDNAQLLIEFGKKTKKNLLFKIIMKIARILI